MEIYKKSLSENIINIALGYFDIYTNIDDRIWLKDLFSKLFRTGEKIYFFLMREEDLTEIDELEEIKPRIQAKFEQQGLFAFLHKLDDRRFYAVAMVEFDLTTPQFLIDVWKCYYSVSFFVPQNDLTFEEYIEYLEINGTKDVYGVRMLRDQLSNFVCMKGVGADHLYISFNQYSISETTKELNKIASNPTRWP